MDSLYAYFVPLGVAAAAYIVLKILLQILTGFRLYLWPRIGPKVDLKSAYGKWAVITGGSDGIGKGYAQQLAKRGVNVCIISNAENGIVSDIKKNYQVDCMWIDADFSSTDVYSRIERELSTLDDIGILVNNVGMVQHEEQPLSEQNGEFHKKIVNVNVMSMVMMTEMILKRMIKKNKGLIVNMGSITSFVLFPYAAMYSSTKSFVETYSCCLAAELNETNIQVKCLQPWFVKTQLIKGFVKVIDFIDRYFSWTLVDAKTFSASAAATFGCSTPVLYSGHWAHSLLQLLIPYSLLGKAWTAAISKWILKRIISRRLTIFPKDPFKRATTIAELRQF